MKTEWNRDEMTRAVMDEAMTEECRGRALQSLLNGARRRRSVRRMGRITGGVVALCMVSWMVLVLPRWGVLPESSSPRPQDMAFLSPDPGQPQFVPGTTIRVLSDEDLFAMFPGRPMALVGAAEHPRVLFLDEVP